MQTTLTMAVVMIAALYAQCAFADEPTVAEEPRTYAEITIDNPLLARFMIKHARQHCGAYRVVLYQEPMTQPCKDDAKASAEWEKAQRDIQADVELRFCCLARRYMVSTGKVPARAEKADDEGLEAEKQLLREFQLLPVVERLDSMENTYEIRSRAGACNAERYIELCWVQLLIDLRRSYRLCKGSRASLDGVLVQSDE